MSRARADHVWRRLVATVMDSRDGYRREVAAATGLPFGRARVLRRLADGPLTLAALADASGNDAPATTVAVNALEARKLVVRTPHPTNGRAKLVTLTAAGKQVVARIRAVGERTPDALATAAAGELDALEALLDRLATRR